MLVTSRNLIFMFSATSDYLASRHVHTGGLLRPQPHRVFCDPVSSDECFGLRIEAEVAAANAYFLASHYAKLGDFGRCTDDYDAFYLTPGGLRLRARHASPRMVWEAVGDLLLEWSERHQRRGMSLLEREKREAVPPPTPDVFVGHDGRSLRAACHRPRRA